MVFASILTNNLISIAHAIWLAICCLSHNKADVKNVSISMTLYLKFVHFKVILNVHLSNSQYDIAEKKLNDKEWIQ